MKTKAYSYLRMSTNQQLKGDSQRRQLQASQNYIEQNDLTLVESFMDIGISAYEGENIKSGFLGVFMKAVKNGDVPEGSVLIIESLDRLSREAPMSAFEQFSSIINSGIKIVTLSDNQEYTKDSLKDNVGQLYMLIGSMQRANEESEVKSLRLKAAWKNKRKNIKSQKLTGRIPAWLSGDKSSEGFHVVEKKAACVKLIFDMCIEGYGTYLITKFLNENSDSYPPIGTANKWHKSYVTKILNNPAVHGLFQPRKKNKGESVPAGDPVADYYPQLIPEERYLLAQANLRERSRDGKGGGRKGNTFNNLFTKLAICGACGGTIIFKNKGRPPKGGKYLMCSNADMDIKCSCPTWRYEDFELSFLTFVLDIDFDSIIDNKKNEKTTSLTEEISILDEKIERLNLQCNKLVKRLENEEIPHMAETRLLQSLGDKEEEIYRLKKEHSSKYVELSELQDIAPSKTQRSIVNLIDNHSDSLAENELRIFRETLHSHIRKLVDKIVFHNYDVEFPLSDYFIYRDEISQPTTSEGDVFILEDYRLDDHILKAVADKCFKSDQEIVRFFLSEYGRRFYNKLTRKFEVHFKTGAIRVVQPAKFSSYVSRTARHVDNMNRLREISKSSKSSE